MNSPEMSTPDQEHQEAMREIYGSRQQAEATERNSSRGIIDKITGRNKVTGVDVAHEQAETEYAAVAAARAEEESKAEIAAITEKAIAQQGRTELADIAKREAANNARIEAAKELLIEIGKMKKLPNANETEIAEYEHKAMIELSAAEDMVQKLQQEKNLYQG